MSEIAKRLRDRRQNVWEQAKALADTAAEENRAFTSEEQGSWDALNEELENLDKRIKSALDTEQRSKDADAAYDRIVGGGKAVEHRDGTAVVTPADQELVDQFRKLARGEQRMVEVAWPNAFERRQFQRGQVEQRATLVTSGDTVPVTFMRQLYQVLVDTSSIRAANPRVITTSNGEGLTLPRATAYSSATWIAEGAQITESEPTLDSVTLNAYKAALTMYVSRELVDDAGFDLLGFLSEQAGRGIGLAADAAYVSGDGTGKPTGLLGAVTGLTADAGNSTAFATGDPLIDLFHAVIPPYRRNASWLMNDATVASVRKVKDTTTGQYVWQPGLQAGDPDRILGRPVYSDPNVPPIAVSTECVLFGDFAGYWIRDVTPLRFDRSDDFKFDTDVVSFRAVYRTDGKTGDVNAIKSLTTSAT